MGDGRAALWPCWGPRLKCLAAWALWGRKMAQRALAIVGPEELGHRGFLEKDDISMGT
jgi:hypothetical protein